MKLGIMQPYFFPCLGYFQVIAAVDENIIYDQLQYVKKGWTDRNQLLANSGKGAVYFRPVLRKPSTASYLIGKAKMAIIIGLSVEYRPLVNTAW